jgi:hypothetical protein
MFGKGWKTDLKIANIINKCGLIKAPKLSISLTAIKKQGILLNEYPNTEYAFDLIGEFDREKNIIYINDIYIFEQKVTSASVDRIEVLPANGSVGISHSHHNLGAFFSNTDDTYANANHLVGGVIAFSNSPIGFDQLYTVKLKTECGHYLRLNDIEWSINMKADKHIKQKWIDEAKQKISPLKVAQYCDRYLDTSPKNNKKRKYDYDSDLNFEPYGLDDFDLDESFDIFTDNYYIIHKFKDPQGTVYMVSDQFSNTLFYKKKEIDEMIANKTVIIFKKRHLILKTKFNEDFDQTITNEYKEQKTKKKNK